MPDQSLFNETAANYAQFRRNCPAELVNLIKAEFNLNESDRILDLGAGTGQSFIPFASLVENIIAVEINPEMIAEGKKKLATQGIQNVEYINMAAENINRSLGLFDLSICGSSFHWMNKSAILEQLNLLLKPSGGFVIFSTMEGVTGLWNSTIAIDIKVKRIIQKFLGPKRRAGQNKIYSREKKNFTDYLQESAFCNYYEKVIPIHFDQTIQEYIGLLFSTSFANRGILGQNAEKFEKEVRKCLASEFPAGIIHRKQMMYLCVAKRKNENEKKKRLNN